MRKIFGIGETVLDIIFKNEQPQAAKAGGSMLNSLVSLGRMRLPVSLISEYGLDDTGKMIDSFLNENGVDTSFVHHFEEGKTALALAFLDDKNDAHYSFYKNYPSKRLDIDFPKVNENDIILCGSFYAIWFEIREKFRNFISHAKEMGALIIYDPNFRKSHLFEIDRLRPYILENMRLASLVRGSDEDFEYIFGSTRFEEACSSIRPYCRNLVYTANVKGVYVMTRAFKGRFPVKKIKPVSTIGAGDNFNAGMITAMYHKKIVNRQLEEMGKDDWGNIISLAIEFASEVCMSYENYISPEFAKSIRSHAGLK